MSNEGGLIDSFPSIGKEYFNGDFLLRVKRGLVPGHRLDVKFGRNSQINTATIDPIAVGGFYQTPQAAEKLLVKSDNAADAIGGLGMQKIYIEGCDINCNKIFEILDMNGTTGVETVNEYFRCFRAYGIQSGTYATQISASQKGTVSITSLDEVDLWLRIDTGATLFGVGQSQVGVMTTYADEYAVILSKIITVNGLKPANIYFAKRENADDVAGPSYSGFWRLIEQHDGIDGVAVINPDGPLTVIPPKADVGFMAIGSVNTSVSVDFSVLYIKTQYMKEYANG